MTAGVSPVELPLEQGNPALEAMFQVAVPLAETDAAARRFVRVNRSFCALTGRSEAELLAIAADDITHPDDLEADRRAYATAVRGGLDRWRSVVRYLLPDGRSRWVVARGALMRRLGTPTGAIVLAEDVSEQRAAEARLETTEGLLRAAHELSLQAFTALEAIRGDGGAIVDFRWTYANPAAGAILQREPAELVGRRLLEVQPGNRDAGLFDVYVGVVETGEPSERDVWYHGEGIEGWFRNSAVRLGDGVAVSFWDITEHKREEEQRERLYREACAANRAKDEFLATLSHELRTPLNAMVGWAQLLLSTNDARTLHRGLEAIARNAAAQTKLIEDILDVSRMVAGRLTLDVTAVDLSPIVQAAVESVRPTAEGKGLGLSVKYRAHPRVTADPLRLQQVFWNLLTNAVKFTDAGGVQVIVDEEGDLARVDVLDTGVGIGTEFLPYVFDRFSQADGSSTRAYGGLGLGLAIVRHLVEAHGGTVSASSQGLGQGSVLTVKLPRDVGSPMLPF